MRRIRQNLSYANVTATLALFVALSGGAYAAIDLVGRNDITSKHIAPDAVKGADAKESTFAGLRCSPGTRYHAAACLETGSRAADDWVDATADCEGRDGRLPTVAELETFRNVATLAGGSEWTSQYWRDADDAAAENFWARVVGESGSGDSLIASFHAYRCAYAPR